MADRYHGVPVPHRKIRLSLVVDFFDGKVVSSSLSARPEAELVNTIVDKAVET